MPAFNNVNPVKSTVSEDVLPQRFPLRNPRAEAALNIPGLPQRILAEEEAPALRRALVASALEAGDVRPMPIPGVLPVQVEPIAPVAKAWNWNSKATLAAKHVLLKEKIDEDLLSTLHNRIIPGLINALQTNLPYGLGYAVSMMSGTLASHMEDTIVNMFANLILHIEKETGLAFPKENSLFALLDYVSKGTQHAHGFYDQLSAIESDKKLNPEQKQAAKLAIMKDVSTGLLAIACPHQGEDLSVPGMLKGFAWGQIESRLPGLLLDLVDPMIKSQKQAAETEAFLKGQPGGQELLNLIRLGSNQVQKITASILKNKGQDVLFNAEAVKHLSKTEKMIYQLATALGADKSTAFKKLVEQVGTYVQPVLLHVIGHLLEGKGNNQDHVVTYLFDKLAGSAFNFCETDGAELDAAYKAQDAAAMRSLLAGEAVRVLNMAGLDEESLKGLLPMGLGAKQIYETAAVFLVGYYVEFYLDIVEAKRKIPTFSRPLTGYNEAAKTVDLLVEETVIPSLKKMLQEPGSPLGTTFVELINGMVFERGVSASALFYTDALKEIAGKPVFDKIGKFASSYISQSMKILLGNLAASNPDNPAENSPVDMLTSALNHLIKIVHAEIQDPELIECLTMWKAMPQTTLEEKAAKDAARVTLVKAFMPVSKKLMASMGAHIDANLLLPESSKKKVRDLLEKTVLPGLLFDIASDTAITMPFSAADQARLAGMHGVARLDLIGGKVAHTAMPGIKSGIKDFSYLIANKVNENTAASKLGPQEEAVLGQAIQQVVASPKPEMEATWGFVKGLVGQLIGRGLKSMALNFKGLDQGDALANVILQIRTRFAEQNLPAKLYKQIAEFVENTAALRKIEDELSALRAQATAQAPNYNPADLLEKVAIKAAEFKHAGVELSKRYNYKQEQLRLLALFQPLAIQILADMGYSKAADLPIWSSLQGTTYASLRDSVLPDQLMRVYYDHLRFHKSSKVHKDHLDEMSPAPAGQKHGKFVKAASIFADTALKYGDNWMIANVTSLADLIAGGLDIPTDIPEVPKVGATLKVNGKVLGKQAPGKGEFLWNAARKEVKGALLQIMDNFLTNVKKLEQDDPQRMFGMMMNIVTHMTNHLSTINGVAKAGGVKSRQLHEVNPIDVVDAFGVNRHAATPDGPTLRALAAAKEKLAAARTNAERKVALNAVRAIEERINKQMDDHFFKGFTTWFLGMANIRKAEDLNVNPSLQPVLWKQLNDSIGPNGLRSTFGTLNNPEMMNMTLMKLLTIIDKNMAKAVDDKKKGIAPPPAKAPKVILPRKEKNVQDFKDLVSQLGDALPETWTQKLLNWEFINNLSGENLESIARASLQDWMLQTILEEGFAGGSESVPTDPLPVTEAEIQAAKAKGAAEDVTNKSGFTTRAVSIMNRMRQIVRESLATTFFGWICMRLFKLPYELIWKALGKSMAHKAEHVRKDIVNMPVHANFGFRMGDALVGAYPIKV